MRCGPLAQQNRRPPPLGGDKIEQPSGDLPRQGDTTKQPSGDLPLRGDTIQPSGEPPLQGNTNQQPNCDLPRRGDSSRSQDNGLMSGLLPPHLNDGSKRRRIEKTRAAGAIVSYWSRHQGHFSIMLQFEIGAALVKWPKYFFF